jgi:hypothetical protein
MSELETRRSSAAAPTDPAGFEPVEAIDAETVDLGGELAEIGEARDLDELDGSELDGTDADLLSLPPRADDLGTALAARPPRAKLPRVTAALAASALICAGFIGGVLVQKHLGGSSSSGRNGFAGFAATRTGAGTGTTGGTGTGTTGGGFGGFGGRGGTGAGGAITGTVTVVSGDTLYVTAADGSVYTVKTSGSTTVNVTQSGKLSQLKPGQTVVIAGSNDGSGNVTATSITAGGATSSGSGSGSSNSGSNNSTGGQ